MQKKILSFTLTLLIAGCLHVKAQNTRQDSTYKRWFVGSTLLMFGNLDKVNSPEFIQVNVGYRITPRDVVSFEFKRSIYAWPLGIPWGPSFDAPGLNYPGHARILAPTVAYQRFWWKGAYTSLHALNAFEKYLDETNKKIGNGYTLYLTFRLGYQIKLFKNRFFFEPSIGLSYWPIRTNVPQSFKAVENKWPNYFPWEPGLHIGYNF
ncbi:MULTISPECIES: hypothetical protein [unclassified Spirosoma]|uniref:hypothetical protein n=1 Tax=unclassified Spirosoma TaxID=2621999 RepID=UPI000967E166|nr:MULTISPECIES: hypothetical protein [unclassified Spirosoma]MBN8822378.1 hypothetical protein [Spirosoma sp.]OJW72325.1 MAG: hypothetical protein BGO59_14365 [Spirosoma sp. 48-14]